ncbi:MAG: ATP-binding protein [Syntrophorhabdaceae bacterium]|nr:ATP-binding protein [Syntrophorhabdaceae bacterium]
MREVEENGGSILLSYGLTERLIEIIKTGVILTDEKATICFVNNLVLKLLKHKKESLIGQPIETIFMPEDRDIFLKNIINITKKDGGFEGEAMLLGKNGCRPFVYLSTAMYRDDPSNTSLMIFTMHDITRFKEMEKACEQQESFVGLGTITDQISHHIRNPIVSIGGFALRLAKEQLSREDYMRYTNIIHNEARRLEYIIDRLAEFTRIQAPVYGATTLSEILKGLKDGLSKFPKGMEEKIIFPDEKSLLGETVYCDLSLITKALLIIVQNSLESLKNGGEVRIEGKIENHLVSFYVKDNGEGISQKHLPHIFNPFFTTKFDNLGLGLTLAKRILEVHKGNIEVSSTKGEGTTVYITFPTQRRREIRTRRL